MAIKIGANFAYNGKLPNFERDKFETKAAMKAFDENNIDEGHLSYCEEDGNIYQYKSANTVDATTGRWRIFKTEADATLNGTSTNPIQNKAVFEALKSKADVVALAAYQPKYDADYIATSDLSILPITTGIIDLNGYQINLPNVIATDGYLTIRNGIVVFDTTITKIEISGLTFEKATVSCSDDVSVTLNIQVLECHDVLGLKGLRCNFIGGNSTIRSAAMFNSFIDFALPIAQNLNVYNSTCYINGNVKLTAYNSFVGDEGLSLANGSAWDNTQLDIFPHYNSGWVDEAGKMYCDMYFDDTITGDSDYAPQTKAVYNALQLKADKTQLNGLATKTELNGKADAVALDKYQSKYKADYIAKADFNYSELAADVHVIDLNGYTLSINSATRLFNIFLNGTIVVETNGVDFDGNEAINCTIYSNNDAFNIRLIDAYFYNCSIQRAVFSGEPEFYNCTFNNCTFGDSDPIIYNSIINHPKITGAQDFPLYNVIIDDVVYKQAIIENGKFVEAGYVSDIYASNVAVSNAPSCEAVKTALQLKADKTQLNGLATKTELNGKADKAQLTNYVTTATANSTYAKKSDISNVYKFKGTKTNYADLPTTNRVTGDVWNITNADAEHGIKAGDNVAWNGTAWDNLSGTVDLSAYATTATTDAMSADIKKLMDKAFPFTVKVSIDKTLAKKGTSQPVKVTITPKIGDDNTDVNTIFINGVEHHGAIPYVYSDTATTTTTYNVRADKDGRTAQGSATITFVNPSYDGVVAANFTVTEANIKALTETLRSGKGGTRTFNLNNQKACIAYPKAFGAATGIKDANGFDYLDSYTRSELNVNGELYYVYLLTNATTITDIKQTIS